MSIRTRPTRWLELASALWTTGEAIYLVGLIVVAFEVGGPAAVALVAVLQSLPSVVLAPLVMAATDRVPYPRRLAAVLAVRCASVAAAGVLLALDGPAVVVFGLATVDGLASTVLRPIRSVLVPMIARSPDELVTANVGITTGASAASLVGPGLAALVLATASAEGTFLFGAALLLVALAASFRLREAVDARPRHARSDGRG